jgi:hypothetical protein
MYEYCQVCGSPMINDASHGTDANGQYNRDFCSNCYRNGQFSGTGCFTNPELFNSGWNYIESPMALAAPYYPGIYGYMGYNMMR